ncbi:histidinol-phosphate transaminase [Flavobacterium sp. CAU 1735]|uniref:histidinol-phosphate transaminase n=1 Tax=Flavobacterium sp. CAU 1735 TaxID=3140361 RepID=UPI003261D338
MKTVDLNKLVRNTILKMKPYTSARDEFNGADKGMIFLDANESPFENGWNRYPDSKQLTVKKKIGIIKDISENRITLGNGSDEILDLIFRVFCEPGKDNIISLPPTYGMYSVLADLNGIENREVLLTTDFQPDITPILEQVDKRTKLLFLCSPNNPTGNLLSEESIRTLLDRFNGIVVLDEAYVDFTTQESWIRKGIAFDNLIVIQTLSKAYGMAGIRLGMAFASPEITALLHKIKPPYNIGTLQQEKVTLINNIEKEIALIQKEKKVLVKVLLQVNFITKIYPSDANFLLIRVDNADKRYRQLLENGIVVRNRNNYPLCDNCLRITIGTPDENRILTQVILKIQETAL